MTNENTNKPYPVNVREGKNHFICSCKLTKRQPFCDVAHIDTDNQPYMYKAEETKEIYFCGCKESKIFHFVMDIYPPMLMCYMVYQVHDHKQQQLMSFELC